MQYRGMLVKTGTLNLAASAGVTGYQYAKSDTIDLTGIMFGNFTLWTQITGDTGKTGATVVVTWEGCYTPSGATFVTPTGTLDILSGTSVSGPGSDGVDAATFNPDLFPYMKVKALHNGSTSTATCGVNWALVAN